jgi:hypothetical protein
MTLPWPTTGPDGDAPDPPRRWTRPPGIYCRCNVVAAHTAEVSCCTPMISHEAHASGTMADTYPEGDHQAAHRLPGITARRTDFESVSRMHTVKRRYLCRRHRPDRTSASPRAPEACLSRDAVKAASPVLRGPRRSNAPGLPD